MEINKCQWRLFFALDYISFFFIFSRHLQLNYYVHLALVSLTAIILSPPPSFSLHCNFFVGMRSRFETFLLEADAVCLFSDG
jgi:hypothetical protein